MPTSHAAFFYCLIVCLALLTACWEGISHRVVAIVLSVRGEVVYRSPETDVFRKIGSDTRPGVGGVVRTADAARLDITLLPGALLRISGNSELRIEELKLTKDGNETESGMLDRLAQVRLSRGKIIVYFQQPDGAEGQVAIVTDRVTIKAQPGSLFEIETDASKTRLTTAAGEVYASLITGGTSAIGEGYFQEWPSEQSAAMPAAGDARGQLDLAEALRAGKDLDELEAEQPPYIPW